jgi:sugar phosphate isomerase/epimerase
MMKTGFKMVNDPRNKELLRPMVERFRQNAGVHAEVGFYFSPNETDELFKDAFRHSSGRVAHHLRHNNTVMALKDRPTDILREIKHAKSMSSEYSVIHLAASNPGKSVYDQLEVMERTLPLFAELNRIARDHDYAFYLENIYYNVPFYRGLFYQMMEDGLDRIHFCMDLGHAKACSENTIGEWYEFLRELESNGRKIHFHLHLNYGVEDDHLSMIEYTATQGDWFSGGVLYDRLIRELILDFSYHRKIFEVKPDHAISNIDYVQRLLGEPSEMNSRSRVLYNDVLLSKNRRVS